jgi:hypothetical protein
MSIGSPTAGEERRDDGPLMDESRGERIRMIGR